MEAAYFEEHGGPEVIKIGELPDPVAGAGEIVIDISMRPLLMGRIGKSGKGRTSRFRISPMY